MGIRGLIDSGLGSKDHGIRINEHRIQCSKILKSALTAYNGDYPEQWDEECDGSDDDEISPGGGQ
jgi:hypothetical protein